MEFLKEYLNKNSINNDDTKIKPTTIRQLFQKNPVQQHYRSNINEYCDLIIAINDDLESKEDYALVLNDHNLFHKSFIECGEFREVFLKTILTKLIENWMKYENDPNIFESICTLTRKSIFDKNMVFFDCYINQHPTETCSDEHKLCRLVFEFLQSTYSKDIVSYGFKIIFKSFSSSYENNFDLNYKLLLFIFNLIGFNLKNHFKLNNWITIDLAKLNFNRTLEITNHLIDCLSTLKINTDHKIDDVTLNDFIKNILKSILPLTQHPNNYCYDIILKIIEFNPLIIDSMIDDIIIYIIVTDNSGIMEKYCQVFIKIIELFSKLNRTNFFISRLLRVLQTNYYNGRQMNKTIYEFNNIIIQMKKICLNIDDILPKNVLNAFTNCLITKQTSRQIINQFKTLIFHFNEIVDQMQQNCDKPLIYLEIVATLLCQFLNSVRVVEHATNSSVITKFHSELNELSEILKKFATTLLHQEYNDTLMKTFLNVCYHWGEIYMILIYYRPDDVTLTKTEDNDPTACNITYLHQYLTKEQWCLLSERVMNFGEKSCKGIMYKLMVQKLRAMTIFDDINDDIITTIVKELHSTCDYVDIITTKFVINHLIDKLPSNVVIELCETILNDLMNNHNSDLINQSHIYDNQLIINGILCNIFMKIKQLLKQKRRHDDHTVRKSLVTKILKNLPNDLFFNQNLHENIPQISQFLYDSNEQLIDIKIDEDKICKLIDCLRRLPIIFCDEIIKKILFLLLIALYIDLCSSNCSDNLKTTCETTIIGAAKSCKLPLIEINSPNFLQLIITKFNRYENLYHQLVHQIFKNQQCIPEFQQGIDYLVENIDNDRHFECVFTTLQIINRSKYQSLCTKQESIIYTKLFNILKKRKVDGRLIGPYVLTLKYFIKNNDERLNILKSRLDEFLEYIFNNLDDKILNNFISLCKVILNNKSVFECKEDLVLNLWHHLKTVKINDDLFNDYSHLLSLILVQISTEQFIEVLRDFVKATENSLNNLDLDEIVRCMKNWTCILMCNFNVDRAAKFYSEFEKLLHVLIDLVKTIDYREDVFNEITNLFVTTTQRIQFVLTPDIMDSFFIYTTVLITISQQSNFIHLFNLSMSIIENLLIHRSALIMDRLSAYLLQYRLLLRQLCLYANSDLKCEQHFIQELSTCALKLEKLTRILINHQDDMTRIAPYLISDILAQYELRPIRTEIKLHLNNCLYALISLCDKHAVKFLMTFLSNASTEIFKLTHINYKKYYLFKGKV